MNKYLDKNNNEIKIGDTLKVYKEEFYKINQTSYNTEKEIQKINPRGYEPLYNLEQIECVIENGETFYYLLDEDGFRQMVTVEIEREVVEIEGILILDVKSGPIPLDFLEQEEIEIVNS